MERRLFFSNVCQRVVLKEEAQVPTAPHYHRLFPCLSTPAPFEKNTLLRNITFSPQGKYISWKVVGALLREKVEIHGWLPPHLHFFFFPPAFFALRMSTRENFSQSPCHTGIHWRCFLMWSSFSFHEINLSLLTTLDGFSFICFALWHFICNHGVHFMPHYISQVADRGSYE